MKNTIRKILLVVMVLIGVMAGATMSYAKPATDVAIYIDGKEQTVPADMGKVFIDSQSRTQVPLRFISEKLGHQVDWDGKKQQVNIDGKAIILKIGDKNIKVNGKTVVMDTAPVTIKNRTYVPVRFIAEGLGHSVEYRNISGKNVIYITRSGAAITPPVENEDDKIGAEYRPGDARSYTYPETQYGYNERTKHWIDPTQVGSNTRNTTSRAPGTAFIDDLAYLNSLVGNTGYGFARDGQLTIGGKNTHLDTPVGSSGTTVAISHVPGKEGRAVNVGGFITKHNTNPHQSQISQHNITVESIKYFAKSTQDGLAIISYITKHTDESQYPPFNKDLTFGDTTIQFKKSPGGWGFDIFYNY